MTPLIHDARRRQRRRRLGIGAAVLVVLAAAGAVAGSWHGASKGPQSPSAQESQGTIVIRSAPSGRLQAGSVTLVLDPKTNVYDVRWTPAPG